MSLDGKDRRKRKRDRVDCPRCGRPDVTISHINSKMRLHRPPDTTTSADYCNGSGYSPNDVRAHLQQEALEAATRARGKPQVMTQRLADRLLVGRRITAVEVRYVPPHRGAGAHDAVQEVVKIRLDDGAFIAFGVAELPSEYGVELLRVAPRQRSRL